MAKKTKTTKAKAKVKKVRTPEEKAARNARRKARRESRKHAAQLSNTIAAKNSAAVTPIVTSTVFPWAERPATSDGLPYSKSVDNPDSLLGQLAREKARMKAEAEEAKNAAKKNRATPRYTPIAKECIINPIMS